MRRIWPIDGDDRFQIPALLAEWGYPRELQDGELAISWWYGVGRDGVFWYNASPDHPPGSAMLHVCLSPEMRGTTLRREWVAVELIAELRGVKLLITEPKTERQRQSLLRMGWEEGKDNTVTRDLRDAP